MKKTIVTMAAGIFFASTAITTVAAEEYEVQKGDSLWKIAQEYNTTVDELADINNLETTVIRPKQKLFINGTYIVEKGDTLSGIGKEYDVAVQDIKKWNDLESDLIVIGQELEIKGVNVVKDEQDKPSHAVPALSEQENSSQTVSNQENKRSESPEGKTITVTATAYTADCAGCTGITSTGIDLNKNPGAKVIAVDPKVIPIGSEVYVEGYGNATAADTGSAIKGNKIDVYLPAKKDAKSWGVRTVKVTVLE